MAEVENLKSEEQDAIEELRKRLKNVMDPSMYEDTLLFYRFLKARDFNVNKAESMLRKHLVWRKAYKVDTILEDFKPPPAFDYIAGTCLGEDKEGCLVRYIPFGNIDMRDAAECMKINDFMRSWTWLLENDLAQVQELNKKTGRKASKYSCILNLDNASFSTLIYTSGSPFCARPGDLYQDNYPERLKAYFLINAPEFFVIIYSAMKKLLATEVVRKIHIYGRSGWKEELLKMIDADVLPAFLGGNKTDPDGNPMCNTFVYHGARIPSTYHLSKEARSFKDKSRVKQITVSPKKSEEVPVEITDCETVIEWEYEVENKDIGFGLHFRESEQELKEILPVYRFDTMDGTETGSHKCKCPGTYVFVFDNTFSWLNTKKVSYCITVIKPEE